VASATREVAAERGLLASATCVCAGGDGWPDWPWAPAAARASSTVDLEAVLCPRIWPVWLGRDWRGHLGLQVRPSADGRLVRLVGTGGGVRVDSSEVWRRGCL
jgi:hypothetical protein